MTYEEAVESEQKAKKRLGDIPKPLKKALLWLADRTRRGKLSDVVDDVYAFAGNRFFLGEVVEGMFTKYFQNNNSGVYISFKNRNYSTMPAKILETFPKFQIFAKHCLTPPSKIFGLVFFHCLVFLSNCIKSPPKLIKKSSPLLEHNFLAKVFFRFFI